MINYVLWRRACIRARCTQPSAKPNDPTYKWYHAEEGTVDHDHELCVAAAERGEERAKAYMLALLAERMIL